MIIPQGRNPHSARAKGWGEGVQNLPACVNGPAGPQLTKSHGALARRPNWLPMPGTGQNGGHGDQIPPSAAKGAMRP